MPSPNRKSAVIWERANRKTVGCQLSRKDAEAVAAYAAAHGETTSGLIKRLLAEEIKGGYENSDDN